MQKERKASQQFNSLLSFDNNIIVTKVVDKTLKYLEIQEKTATLLQLIIDFQKQFYYRYLRQQFPTYTFQI
jgi:hypothetical protein